MSRGLMAIGIATLTTVVLVVARKSQDGRMKGASQFESFENTLRN
jgi:hypothetical protein